MNRARAVNQGCWHRGRKSCLRFISWPQAEVKNSTLDVCGQPLRVGEKCFRLHQLMLVANELDRRGSPTNTNHGLPRVQRSLMHVGYAHDILCSLNSQILKIIDNIYHHIPPHDLVEVDWKKGKNSKRGAKFLIPIWSDSMFSPWNFGAGIFDGTFLWKKNHGCFLWIFYGSFRWKFGMKIFYRNFWWKYPWECSGEIFFGDFRWSS